MSKGNLSRDLEDFSRLTPYQQREVRRMIANGWTFLRIRKFATDENPWATMELRKGDYSTVAAMPATARDEAYFTGEAI